MSEILGALFKYLMAALGIAAVAGVLYMVFAANKVGKAQSDLTTLQTNIQSVYSQSTTFTTLTNAAVTAGGWAPSSMIAGGSLVNPWSGVVTVSVNPVNNTHFDTTETNVPTEACTKMAIGMTASVGIAINGVAQTLPIDPAGAAIACNQNNNTMTFTIGH